MIFRKATKKDLHAIVQIYSDIHTGEENSLSTIGWIRNIYPTEKTAKMALERDDLFVEEDNGIIVGSAIINQRQDEMYKDADWEYDVPDHKVMVLHTLTISPQFADKGYGKRFVNFYENYALEHNCPYLRMDTNERNARARAMYQKLGYKQVGIVPCSFNGIENVRLVMLEKTLTDRI